MRVSRGDTEVWHGRGGVWDWGSCPRAATAAMHAVIVQIKEIDSAV